MIAQVRRDIYPPAGAGEVLMGDDVVLGFGSSVAGGGESGGGAAGFEGGSGDVISSPYCPLIKCPIFHMDADLRLASSQ